MSIILSVFAGLVIVALLQLFGPGKKSKQNDIYEPEPENEKGEGGYILDMYCAPERLEGDGVLKALLSAYRDLRKQRAGGVRGWIPACIEQAQRGYEIPPEVALMALRKTRDEMSAPRYEKEGEPSVYYDLTGLDNAIAAVEKEMGEGA